MQRVSIVRIPLLNFQQVTQNRIILIIGPSFQRLNYISWYHRARIPLRIIFVFSFRHRINNIQQSECHLAIYSFGHKEYVVFFFLSIQLNEKWCNWMRRIVRPIPNEIVTVFIRMHKLFWARKECEFDVKFANAAKITYGFVFLASRSVFLGISIDLIITNRLQNEIAPFAYVEWKEKRLN